VNVYANGRSVLEKSDDELVALRRLKLNTLYVGMESGDDDLLLIDFGMDDCLSLLASGFHCCADGHSLRRTAGRASLSHS